MTTTYESTLEKSEQDRISRDREGLSSESSALLDKALGADVGEYVPRKVKKEPVSVITDTSREDAPVKTQSAEEVQEEMLRGAQGEIDAINLYAKDLLADQHIINEKNDRSTSSISTLTGLAGSTEANVAQQATTAVGQKANQKIQNEAAMKIQGIMGAVRQSAYAEARAQRQDARLDEETRIKNRAARQEEAVTQLTNLSAGGVTFEGLKNGDPESFAYLTKQFGGEEALRGAFVLNTPVDQILDKRVEGGKYVIAKQNPLTGKISIETVDLGIPVGYTKTVDAGDRILAIPDNWSGDPSELITINKGLSPSSGGGLTPGQINTTVNSIAGAFDNEPIVKNFNTVSEGYQFVTSLGEKENPTSADDQGLVYAFAKAMDPQSAVKEGEYITVQKYNQSLIQQGWANAKRIASNVAFLTPEARKNMIATIKSKYEASKASYTNVKTEYQRQIDDAYAGKPRSITSYEGANSGVPQSPSKTLVDANGEAFDASELTPEEYEQAIADGYTPGE